ncbi:uncharacterized protein LOC135336710 [Halichondria panicea]|uniref:uncharacterized protein LOC135336710 n=1 Tax=Halichondria panicea TaxID=6063 RepID=UPI00312BB060
MESNVAYNVFHANNRQGKAIALQENTAYDINEISSDEINSSQDNVYSLIENNGRETLASKNNTAYGKMCTTKTNSTSNVLSNAKEKGHRLAKNKCTKKWFAFLAVIAFVLSLLIAVAALVYSNVELKNQMISTKELKNQMSSSNKQMQFMTEQLQGILEKLYLGTINNPASSCSDIPQDRPSGEYWIATNTTSSPVQVYCDMNRTSCSCNTTGGWMRVSNLDMTDPNQNCPEGLRLVTRTEPPLRTCGRVEGPAGCTSTTYSTYGMEYSKVCGRIIAYQSGSPDGFTHDKSLSIDGVYVNGVSLTHGQSPRQHIWTFANALHEHSSINEAVCPCTRPDLPYAGTVPHFIGQDYFCETGSRQRFRLIFYPDDPLWDGQGCGGTSTCCEFNNPPWFCKQLPQPTTDDIELRLCGNEVISNEDTPIEIVEMYVR